MAAKKKIFRRPVKTDCVFCKEGRGPNYKNHGELAQYVSDRAKIIGRARTGICSKHQRKLSKAIKRARHLGLLPFAPKA